MPQLTLDDFRSSRNGRLVETCLRSASLIDEMVKLARAGRTPLIALDAALPIGTRLGNTEKHHAGRMVRDRMNERGWRVKDQRSFRGGRIFSSGSVYEALERAAPATERDSGLLQRVARAQEIVHRASRNHYSVDDFIRDKRMEAAREHERDGRKYGP